MEQYPEFEIWPPFEVFYLQSLESCTVSALMSADLVVRILPEYAKEGQDRPPSALLLNALQNIASQAGSISRFFWPSRKEYKPRGRFLRHKLCISDDNPLKERGLRNRMEHYDEYLDDYLKDERMVGIILPDYVGPEPVRNAESVPGHLFRAYFTDTGRVSILGVAFDLPPILEAIRDLDKIVESCLKNGGRLPNP